MKLEGQRAPWPLGSKLPLLKQTLWDTAAQRGHGPGARRSFLEVGRAGELPERQLGRRDLPGTGGTYRRGGDGDNPSHGASSTPGLVPLAGAGAEPGPRASDTR